MVTNKAKRAVYPADIFNEPHSDQLLLSRHVSRATHVFLLLNAVDGLWVMGSSSCLAHTGVCVTRAYTEDVGPRILLNRPEFATKGVMETPSATEPLLHGTSSRWLSTYRSKFPAILSSPLILYFRQTKLVTKDQTPN